MFIANFLFFFMLFYTKNNYLFFFLNKFYLIKVLVFFIKMIKTSIDLKKNNFFLYFIFIFFLLLILNVLSIFPYAFAVTSHICFTFFISFSFFIGLLLVVLSYKFFNFFSIFFPTGSPLFMVFVLVPVEFVSYFFRVFSLALRLFANITAGHVLLKVLAKFS